MRRKNHFISFLEMQKKKSNTFFINMVSRNIKLRKTKYELFNIDDKKNYFLLFLSDAK